MRSLTQIHGNTTRLILIAAAAGLFSAVAGVGGGVVIVPLLMALLGVDARVATATSLAAIAAIAIWGVAAYGVLGDVNWVYAALVGVPALVGVTAGVRLRQHLSPVHIARVFAGVLVVAAVLLLVLR